MAKPYNGHHRQEGQRTRSQEQRPVLALPQGSAHGERQRGEPCVFDHRIAQRQRIRHGKTRQQHTGQKHGKGDPLLDSPPEHYRQRARAAQQDSRHHETAHAFSLRRSCRMFASRPVGLRARRPAADTG